MDEINKKHNAILAREKSQAGAIAASVVKPAPIGVWDVLIPIVFILNYIKGKQDREFFAQNFLFTKNLALEAALDMVKNGKTRESVLSEIEEKTLSVLEAADKNVYSDDIRKPQTREIVLLLDHDFKLLKSDGGEYAELVANAYADRQSYETFLNQLKSAEDEVMQASVLLMGDRANLEFIERIRQATVRIREAEINRIFPAGQIAL